ncbi:MAG: hypothetical protein SYR96_01660 [Actinomycetota bacterium]|nr:hypothetical protein [Actinomycetota bacterium]
MFLTGMFCQETTTYERYRLGMRAERLAAGELGRAGGSQLHFTR